MQLSQQEIHQVYVSDTDTLDIYIYIYISPFFEGAMIKFEMEDFFYFVGFKDVSISETQSNRGVLQRAFNHMLSHPERCVFQIPDIHKRFSRMQKIAETYILKYFPEMINHIRSCFCIVGNSDY